MELKVVHYAVTDRVATITLSRPQRLNAWTGRMHAEYRWALAEAERDGDVRAIVVTGAGRGFCAGADAAALDKHVEAGGHDSGVAGSEPARPGVGGAPEYDQPLAVHLGVPKPIIPAIHRPDTGGWVLPARFLALP